MKKAMKKKLNLFKIDLQDLLIFQENNIVSSD